MLGVKGKFMLVAAVIVALSSAVWGGWIMRIVDHLLFEKLEATAQLLVTSYHDPIINAIINEELGQDNATLDGIIEDIISSSEHNAVYVFITDPAGSIVASDNWAEYGKRYDDALAREAIQTGLTRRKLIGGRLDSTGILDIALPLSVHGKKWGVLRAGFTLRPLREQLARQQGAIFTLSLIICAVEMLIFYVVGLSLTRPLQGLASAMAAVHPTLLESPLQVDRSDEIGVLQKSFRSMLARLKRSETDRQRAVHSAIQAEKLAVIGKLVAGVAHEINNPLAAMISCIHNLRKSSSSSEVEEIETMEQACHQIENIVRQLLDFNRAGQLLLESIPSDSFFREIVSLAEMAVRKKNVVLMAEDRCQPPHLLTIDPCKLKQVVLNLLMNAAEASPKGATVEVTAHVEDKAYCLTVRDSGGGIPDELQEKIFELFYTLNKTDKGNGIGLAISKNIIDMHCGAILLDSKPGETVFTVIIPLTGEHTNDAA